MDRAVGGGDVGLDDFDVAVEENLAVLDGDGDFLAVDSLGAAELDDIGGLDVTGDDVIRQDAGELVLRFGLERPSSVPAGSLANASSVGANTVNGPAPLRVSTRPAA